MKRGKITAILLVASMLMGLAGCAQANPETTKEDADEGREETEDTEEPEDTEESEISDPTEETEEPLDESIRQDFSYELTDKDHWGITSVDVALYDEQEFYIDAFEDSWSDYVPGIVGISVCVFWMPANYDYFPDSDQEYPTADKVFLTVNYDEDALMGVPEKNLLLLFCIDDSFDCSVVEDAKFDYEKNQVKADITELDGIFMLVDAYEWYQSQGIDASEYAYELPDEIKNLSAWEKEHDTGSIMDLVDRDYIEKNAPCFYVSTPQQLASAVYFVNTSEPGWPYITEIYLENDIDLTGYEWMPMGWISERTDDVYEFVGYIDGQGHTINGLTLDCGSENGGFVGYSTNVTMMNIYFTNANVRSTYDLGICAGQVIGYGYWENVHAQGNLEKVYSTKEGGLVGWDTDLTFVNCSADFTVNSESEVYHYVSYHQKREEEIGITETFKLTLNDDHSVVRDDHDGFSMLMWCVELDGETIYMSSNSDSLTLEADDYMFSQRKGTYTIYLVAHVEDIYIRVSNIVEFTY